MFLNSPLKSSCWTGPITSYMSEQYTFLRVKRFIKYQELLICCIPVSSQWAVCKLLPAGLTFYYWRYLEMKESVYLFFWYYCRPGLVP